MQREQFTASMIREELGRFVSNELISGQNYSDSEDLLSTGSIDSLGVVRLTTHVAETFSIDVPPADLTIGNFQSIDTMTAYVQRKVSEQ